jgi:hypothetical protein
MPGGEDAKAVTTRRGPLGGGSCGSTLRTVRAAATRRARAPVLLYLDQNYLSGIVKRKPAFRELEPVLREAVEAGAVRVPESEVHRIESAARPDLGLLDLLRELSGGLRLPEDDQAPAVRRCARALRALLERDYPHRRPLASDDLDLVALSRALPQCDLVTCDAFMAELVRRARLDTWCGCELFTGRRPDVDRLRRRLVHKIGRFASGSRVT